MIGNGGINLESVTDVRVALGLDSIEVAGNVDVVVVEAVNDYVSQLFPDARVDTVMDAGKDVTEFEFFIGENDFDPEIVEGLFGDAVEEMELEGVLDILESFDTGDTGDTGDTHTEEDMDIGAKLAAANERKRIEFAEAAREEQRAHDEVDVEVDVEVVDEVDVEVVVEVVDDEAVANSQVLANLPKGFIRRISDLRDKEGKATGKLLRIQWDIGETLRDAKEAAGHGNWLPLFEDRIEVDKDTGEKKTIPSPMPMPERTASNYLRLVNSFDGFNDMMDVVNVSDRGFGQMNMTKILAIVREKKKAKKREKLPPKHEGGDDSTGEAGNTAPPKPVVEVDAEIDYVALSAERATAIVERDETIEAQQTEIDKVKAEREQAVAEAKAVAEDAAKQARDNGTETLLKVTKERDSLKAEVAKLKKRVAELEAENERLSGGNEVELKVAKVA